MRPFQFILGLYTIIAGLGVKALVESAAKMIEARDRIHLYWMHTCWLVFLFLVNVASWLSLWQFRDLPSWSVFQAVLLLCIPILLYPASYLAVPDMRAGDGLDMRLHYFKQAHWMQAILFLALLSGLMATRMFDGRADLNLADLVRIGAMVALLPGIFSVRPAVHATQMVVLLLILLVALFQVEAPIK